MTQRNRAAATVAIVLAVTALLAGAAAAGLVGGLVAIGPLLRAVLVLLALSLAGVARELWRWRPRIGAGDIALVLASVAVALVLLEGGVRLREHLLDWNGNMYDAPDDSLGWALAPSVNAHTRFGTQYSTTAEGLRARLNPGGTRRVLVIGDSYTQAVQVDADSTFWGRLARAHPDVQFVVAGVAGYATLQEVMLIERLVQREQPDVVLWQLCANDYIGNSVALERRSLWNNIGMRRPYWASDRVVYADPSPAPSLASSALYRVLAGHIAILRAEQLGARSVELSLDSLPVLADSVDRITTALLRRGVLRAGPAPVLAFMADTVPPAAHMRRAAARAGVALVDVQQALRAAERSGASIHASALDAHWSAAGHAAVASALHPAISRALGAKGATP